MYFSYSRPFSLKTCYIHFPLFVHGRIYRYFGLHIAVVVQYCLEILSGSLCLLWVKDVFSAFLCKHAQQAVG